MLMPLIEYSQLLQKFGICRRQLLSAIFNWRLTQSHNSGSHNNVTLEWPQSIKRNRLSIGNEVFLSRRSFTIATRESYCTIDG